MPPDGRAEMRAVLRWAIGAGAVLRPTPAGGLAIRSPSPMPVPLVPTLHRIARRLASFLAATGAPSPLLALVVVWYLLERPGLDADALAERVAVRVGDGGFPAPVAELLALADLAGR